MPKKKEKKNDDFDSDEESQISIESKGTFKEGRGNVEKNEKVASKSNKKKRGKNALR
jgi:hypothetical protein